MNVIDVVVIVGALGLAGFLAWFFFGPKPVREAELREGSQEVLVTVKGGYTPDLIRVRCGLPLRLVFDRQESGDCSSRVVFADLGISQALPAFARTTVAFTPLQAGRFGFACGMNMIHGTLVVEPADHTDGDSTATANERALGQDGTPAWASTRAGW